ncbi:EF-hand domain-containing protein [Streptomyces sp. NPDC058231]|uniref:EF-hand domain-containing protein n=1 Tax=Streptomyces sp. NPDC058231 TaxID=3346392 RepID=UPI0036EBC78D
MTTASTLLHEFARWLQDADRDWDGQITKEELTAYTKENGKFLGSELLSELFDAVDTDGSGTIDREEVGAVFQAEADRIEAATLRVNKLVEPYPTESVRIVSYVGTSLRYYNGVVKKVLQGDGDSYTVTMYQAVYDSDTDCAVKGSDAVVGDTRTYVGPSQTEKRIDRFLNGKPNVNW